MEVITYNNSIKTAANGIKPPKGTNNFIRKYQGCGGISLLSLLTLPGFFIVTLLNPMRAPSHTFGTESAQYTNKSTRIVGKGTAADDFSNQLAKFMSRNIMNMKEG